MAKAAEKKTADEAKQEEMKANLKLQSVGIKKGFKERQKARKVCIGSTTVFALIIEPHTQAKIKSSGKVIGGKLRGCEGIADIAFLEWLVPKGSMGEATLWARYLEDYNVEVPYEMVPRSCVRPPNLKTQLNEVMKRRAQYKGEVKKGREKIEDLRSTESVLDYIKRTEKSKSGKQKKEGLTKTEQMKAAYSEGEGTAPQGSAKGKPATVANGGGGSKTLSVKEIRKKSKSSNPFEALRGL